MCPEGVVVQKVQSSGKVFVRCQDCGGWGEGLVGSSGFCGFCERKRGVSGSVRVVGSQSVGGQSVGGQSIGSQSVGSQSVGSQSIGSQSVADQPIRSQPATNQPAANQLTHTQHTHNVHSHAATTPHVQEASRSSLQPLLTRRKQHPPEPPDKADLGEGECRSAGAGRRQGRPAVPETRP